MQNKYKINNVEIWQPDRDLGYSFSTTYTEDSVRDMSGMGHFTPMFTVEQCSYSAKHVPVAKAREILQMIAKGQRFRLFYFSPYFGAWRTDFFYVGQGNLSIGTLEEDQESISQLAFNMTGVNPI